LNELRAKVTAFGCDLEFVSGRLEQAYDDRTNNLGGDEQLTDIREYGQRTSLGEPRIEGRDQNNIRGYVAYAFRWTGVDGLYVPQ